MIKAAFTASEGPLNFTDFTLGGVAATVAVVNPTTHQYEATVVVSGSAPTTGSIVSPQQGVSIAYSDQAGNTGVTPTLTGASITVGECKLVFVFVFVCQL